MTDVHVTAIYVSWRDTQLLLGSLERLATVAAEARSAEALELVVVINEADTVDSVPIDEVWPGATVIENADNRGFGPAANQGAAAASGDILLFLNPDTLASNDPLPQIRLAFDKKPTAVAVAPALGDEGPTDDAQRLFQLRRLPTLASDARELLLVDWIAPGNRSQRRARYLDADRGVPFAVEQAAAAALAVKRDAFDAIGGFDERFVPAYWEDVDLCKRLGRHGSIVFWPGVRFEHVGGVSADELGEARFRTIYYRNALRYREKHYAWPALISYRFLLVVGMALRTFAVVAGIRRPSSLRGALRGFASVARLALRSASADSTK